MGAGRIAEGSKDLIQGVVGGTASSLSKVTHALDKATRTAGGLKWESKELMETAKVRDIDIDVDVDVDVDTNIDETRVHTCMYRRERREFYRCSM